MECTMVPAHPRLLWRRALLACALLALLLPVSTASPTGATEPLITVDVLVVDGHGHPFRAGTAGVLACPSIGWSVPCGALVVGGDHDGDGHVQLTVQPDVAYRVSGFVTNSGWPDPDFVAPDGTEFHFSPAVERTGAALEGTTFVIERPTTTREQPPRGTTEVAFTVLDGAGRPFPPGNAAVMACTNTPCDPMIVGSADADGVARITLASGVEYSVTALVRNTGWPCGGWVSPRGIVFFFSDPVVGRGGGFHRPTTLTVAEPSCP